MNDQEKVVIGKVSSPHGIKGWLKILSYTDPVDNIFSYKSIFLKKEDEYLPYDIEDYSFSGKIIRVKLAGIDDRNQSEELVKCLIVVNSGFENQSAPTISFRHICRPTCGQTFVFLV